ncbi:MAG: hypothetical protein RIC53_12280 [Cyclobacteriaceae bacterium]
MNLSVLPKYQSGTTCPSGQAGVQKDEKSCELKIMVMFALMCVKWQLAHSCYRLL